MRRLILALCVLLVAVPVSAQIVQIPYINGAGVARGPILVPDGTAAAPSVAFANEPTIGFFRAGATDLRVVISGGTRTYWTPGQFGISPNTLSGSGATSGFVYTQTWNTTGAPVFADWTITDTASDSASLAFRIRGGAGANIPIFQATSRTGLFTFGGLANGQASGLKHATVAVTCSSGATCTAANLIPAGSMVVGVSVRVTTLITGATSISVGDGTDPDRWGAGIAVAAGTTTGIANFTIASPIYYAAATGVVLTAAGSDFTAGVIRITVHYWDLTAATS